MNADDRANPASGVYAPQAPATESSEGSAAGQAPRRTAFRPIAQSTAPTATPPAGTPFQWTGAPSSAPTVPAAAPGATPAPATTTPTNYVAPAEPASAPTTAGAAFSIGAQKVKGAAGRAKSSLTAGDDLAASAKRGGPRKARVLVSRVDPWSVLKIGFLLSIALGIMSVVAVFVLWNALNGFGLFELVNSWIERLFDGQQSYNVKELLELNKVMSAAILISVMNVVIMTALTTIGAFLYNTVSSVVGGIYVTLTDD